jgi:hypothetical protein
MSVISNKKTCVSSSVHDVLVRNVGVRVYGFDVCSFPWLFKPFSNGRHIRYTPQLEMLSADSQILIGCNGTNFVSDVMIAQLSLSTSGIGLVCIFSASDGIVISA